MSFTRLEMRFLTVSEMTPVYSSVVRSGNSRSKLMMFSCLKRVLESPSPRAMRAYSEVGCLSPTADAGRLSAACVFEGR